MLPSIAASAVAARAVGYSGLADLIEADQLTPQCIAGLLKLSASRSAAKDYALVILAASIGRYRASPAGWTGEPERTLALTALAGEDDPAGTFLQLSERAARQAALARDRRRCVTLARGVSRGSLSGPRTFPVPQGH